MSFKTIEKRRGSIAHRRGVSIGAVSRGKYIYSRFRFGADILETMNWSPGCHLALAYGDGHDKGKLRIGLDDLNGFTLQKGAPRDKGKYLQCRGIGDGKEHARVLVPHKISNGCLYIDLPDWACPKQAA